MILNLHGEPSVVRIEGGTLGHGPGLEDTVELKAQVVMKPRGSVLLDYETVDLGGGDFELAARFGCLAEVALRPVLRKLHRHHCRLPKRADDATNRPDAPWRHQVPP
jgi:hypothetical protein